MRRGAAPPQREPEQERDAAGGHRQRDFVRIVQLACVANAIVDRVRLEETDVLAPIREIGFALGIHLALQMGFA